MSDATAANDRLAQRNDESPAGEPLPKRVLIVDDKPNLLESLRDALDSYQRPWRVDFAAGGDAALAALADEPADVVIADMQMPG